MLKKNRLWKLLTSGELQLIASSLSFSTILSLVPLLAVSLAAIQYIGGLDALYPKVESIVLAYFQGPTGETGTKLVQKALKRIYAGKLGPWGAIALILASLMLINDMERAFHRIWSLPQRRPLYQRLMLFWTFLILFPACLIILVGLSSLKFLGTVNTSLPIPVIQNILLFFGLGAAFKFIPNTKVSWKAALTGSFISAIGLAVLTTFFKTISQALFTWGKLYGSLAAVPTLLIWVLCIWYIVLIGVAISAALSD